jgi:hypothetical protein
LTLESTWQVLSNGASRLTVIPFGGPWMNVQMRIPDIAELSEFFGSDPVEQSAEDGYWCYEFTDQSGIKLQVSFDTHERSVQTVLSFQERQIATVVHEQAHDFVLRDGALLCVFSSEHSETTLTVRLLGNACITWSTLRTK